MSLGFELPDGVLGTIVAGPATGKTGVALSIVGGSEAHCTVRLDGRDVRSLKERSRLFALVPSDPYLAFSLVGDTVEDEINLGFRFLGVLEDRIFINRLATELEIRHLLERDPMTLSGGEAVRVALMLALIKRPRALVLDDIWDSVDRSAEASLRTLLSEWRRETGGIVLDFRRQMVSGVDGPILVVPAAESTRESRPIAFGRTLDGATRLDGLCATYPGNDSFALGPISAGVAAGSVVALVGRNGAGKTTCLKATAGVTPPRAGDVYVGDTKLTSSTPLYDRARQAQYVFQNPDDQLNLRTVQEELIVAARRFGRDLHELPEVAATLGLDSCLDASPLDQSRSARRLITVGTAFCAGAPLVLLDEPTTGLDRSQAASVARLIHAHAQRGGSVIFVSHDEEFVRTTATSIWHMEAGRIAAVEDVTAPQSVQAP